MIGSKEWKQETGDLADMGRSLLRPYREERDQAEAAAASKARPSAKT